ncbi:MAG: N-acetylmuramoyl-L-alanine amidase [Bacteroidia bacterium]|nr:N-acetylmuramoyl-L-alanine amidase [Bacteroidia bacterium]
MKRITATPLLLLLLCVSSAFAAGTPEKPPVFRVVIDAGHGGQDAGAGRQGLLEKELSLKLAQKVKALGKNSPVEVIMTRSGDEFVSLQDRSKLALEHEAALFLSIHINQSEQPETSGIEIFVSSENARATQSRMFAEGLSRTLQAGESEIPVQGTKEANYLVLKNTTCPAALLEVGYLSNPGDRQNLQNDAFLDHLAGLIWESILGYLEN